MIPKCPNCGEVTHMRKVSGIVAEGTQASSGRGAAPDPVSGRLIPSSYVGVVQTDLARRFTPPPAPRDAEPLTFGCMESLLIILALVGFVPLIFVVAEVVGPESHPLVPIAIIFGCPAAVIVAVVSKVVRRRNKSSAMPTDYLAAMERWNLMWYCSRCDRVAFEDGAVPPPGMVGPP
jgi:hypothetical protein